MTPWETATVPVPSLPEMTRPCARPDLRDALVTPWSSCWVPWPVPEPRRPLEDRAYA